MKAEQLLNQLEAVSRKGQDDWMARCPAHDDKGPSLSITQANDRILLKCFAGCSTEDVVGAMGITMGELFDTPIRATINNKAINNYASEKWKVEFERQCSQLTTIEGTEGEQYLLNRGIALPENHKIWFSPHYERYEKPMDAKIAFPSVITKIYDVTTSNGVHSYNHPISLQAIRLKDAQKINITDVESKIYTNKWTTHQSRYQFCPIVVNKSNHLIIAEGVESTLSAYILLKKYGIESTAFAINSTNMRKFFPLDHWKNHVFHIFVDKDKNYTGQLSALNCAKGIYDLTSKFENINIYMPPNEREDWNDILMKDKDIYLGDYKI